PSHHHSPTLFPYTTLFRSRTSRQSLEAFIKGLEKDDRFEIVTFNVAANPLFRQLRPASEDNRRQGEAFLESQQARGGTVLGPAIDRKSTRLNSSHVAISYA